MVQLKSISAKPSPLFIVTRWTELTSLITSNHHQSLKCLQINLQHSVLAIASLSQLILEINFDVIFKNLTFNCHEKSFTVCLIVINLVMDLAMNIHGAAIICKRSLRFKLSTQYSSNAIAGIVGEFRAIQFNQDLLMAVLVIYISNVFVGMPLTIGPVTWLV